MAAMDDAFTYRTIANKDAGAVVAIPASNAMSIGIVLNSEKDSERPHVLAITNSMGGPAIFSTVIPNSFDKLIVFKSATIRPIYTSLRWSGSILDALGGLHLIDDGSIIVTFSEAQRVLAANVETGHYANPPSGVGFFREWEIGLTGAGNEWTRLIRIGPA